MPKKGQERELPTDLRVVLAENLKVLMGLRGATPKAVEAACGVGNSTVKRLRNAEVAANLDTVQALANAFEIEPWLLLMKGGVAGSVGKVFARAIPDAKLGSAWTRPDRKPLLQSGIAKSSSKASKIKIR